MAGSPYSSNHTGSYTTNLDPLPSANIFGRTLLRVHAAGLDMLTRILGLCLVSVTFPCSA